NALALVLGVLTAIAFARADGWRFRTVVLLRSRNSASVRDRRILSAVAKKALHRAYRRRPVGGLIGLGRDPAGTGRGAVVLQHRRHGGWRRVSPPGARPACGRAPRRDGCTLVPSSMRSCTYRE